MDKEQKTINLLKKDAYKPHDEEGLDVFTHYSAMNYLKKEHPRTLYIAYGETDLWAHEGNYRDYLDAAQKVDKWIGDIWAFVQSSPVYKGNTLLFITVDDERGDADKTQWMHHYSTIPLSDEIWFAAIGPKISAKGEVSGTCSCIKSNLHKQSPNFWD